MMNQVKRVISNPDNTGRSENKISKTSFPSKSEGLPPALVSELHSYRLRSPASASNVSVKIKSMPTSITYSIANPTAANKTNNNGSSGTIVKSASATYLLEVANRLLFTADEIAGRKVPSMTKAATETTMTTVATTTGGEQNNFPCSYNSSLSRDMSGVSSNSGSGGSSDNTSVSMSGSCGGNPWGWFEDVHDDKNRIRNKSSNFSSNLLSKSEAGVGRTMGVSLRKSLNPTSSSETNLTQSIDENGTDTGNVESYPTNSKVGWNAINDTINQDCDNNKSNNNNARNVVNDEDIYCDVNKKDRVQNQQLNPSLRKKKKKKEKKEKRKIWDLHTRPSDIQDVIVRRHSGPDLSSAVTAPTYVLEESLSSQALWNDTAGHRPPQPVDERVFYERLMSQNFQRSNVDYGVSHDVLTANSQLSLSQFSDIDYVNHGGVVMPSGPVGARRPGDPSPLGSPLGAIGGGTDDSAAEEKLMEEKAALVHRWAQDGRMIQKHRKTPAQKETTTAVVLSDGGAGTTTALPSTVVKGRPKNEFSIVMKGDNVFGTTVSKSFAAGGDLPGAADTVSISIASYRVVDSKKHGKFAQFHVIFCQGTFRNTVGVWKRYTDFKKLSQKVSQPLENWKSVLAGMDPLAVTKDHPKDVELLPNAITSWRLLKKRQRWYRCLDAGYLSLKVFLLERFLHDILFESYSPDILRDFVGAHEKKQELQ